MKQINIKHVVCVCALCTILSGVYASSSSSGGNCWTESTSVACATSYGGDSHLCRLNPPGATKQTVTNVTSGSGLTTTARATNDCLYDCEYNGATGLNPAIQQGIILPTNNTTCKVTPKNNAAK